MNTTQNSPKSKIVKVIGVDLAKDHCDVIGYDENGKICLRLDGCSYAKLREILANLPQAVVLMEACKGSMFHARSIADLGHEVRLVKGADVKALRNVNHKNDLRDAAYIAKLYFVPGTTYVYIKSQQQQSRQFLQNEYKGSSSKALFNFTPRELSSITQAKLLHKRLFRVLLKSFLRAFRSCAFK